MARGGIPQDSVGTLTEEKRVAIYSLANFGVWLMGSGVIAIFFGQATIGVTSVVFVLGLSAVAASAVVAHRIRRVA
ncbi:hypothetical protein AGMMS50229_18710 [Campylobacterota bacterium]|nr:hypothetical protein AGMMS50229_18710 [Campylobacterota bacterium]